MSIAEQVRLEAVEREVQELRAKLADLQQSIAASHTPGDVADQRNVTQIGAARKRGDKRG